MAVLCNQEAITVYCGPIGTCEVFYHFTFLVPDRIVCFTNLGEILIRPRFWYLVWVTFYNIAKEAMDVTGEGHLSHSLHEECRVEGDFVVHLWCGGRNCVTDHAQGNNPRKITPSCQSYPPHRPRALDPTNADVKWWTSCFAGGVPLVRLTGRWAAVKDVRGAGCSGISGHINWACFQETHWPSARGHVSVRKTNTAWDEGRFSPCPCFSYRSSRVVGSRFF